MTRETYGVKTVQRILVGLFFGQGIGLLVTVILLVFFNVPVNSGFIEGLNRGLPLVVLPCPFVVTYEIWKKSPTARFFTIAWWLVSGYGGLLYYDRWVNQMYVLGYLSAMITFAVPVICYISILLMFELVKIRKYGIPKESVYKGD